MIFSVAKKISFSCSVVVTVSHFAWDLRETIVFSYMQLELIYFPFYCECGLLIADFISLVFYVAVCAAALCALHCTFESYNMKIVESLAVNASIQSIPLKC